MLVVFIFAISDDELPAGLLQSINLVQGVADHALSEFAAEVLGLRVFPTRIEGLLEIAFVSNKGGEVLNFILIITSLSNDAYINHN